MVSIPVIACGGVGDFSHFASGIVDGNASAVAAGNIFHYIEQYYHSKDEFTSIKHRVRMDSEATYEGRQFDNNGRLMMMSKEDLSKFSLKGQKRTYMIYCKRCLYPSNHPYGMIFDEKVFAWVVEFMKKKIS